MSLYKLDMDRFDQYYPGVHSLYTKKCKNDPDKLVCCSSICDTACSRSVNNCEKNWKTACADNCTEIREFPYKPTPKPKPLINEYEDDETDYEEEDEDISIDPPEPIPNPLRPKKRIGEPIQDEDVEPEDVEPVDKKKVSKSSLTTTEIAGISIGGILLVVLIVLVVFLIMKSKKR